MTLTRRGCLGGMSAALGASLMPAGASAQVKPLPNLPSTMIWSVGDDDGPRYREALAIAEAISKAHGTRIRLQPSENAFGRMEQLKDRQVTHGMLGMEAFFAAEGLLNYVSPTWGPQDLRGLLGRMSATSLIARAGSGISKLPDVKGKRVARLPRNSPLGYRTDVILEAAGITPQDVTLVEFPNNSAALAALAQGEIDCAGAVTTAASVRALDAIADSIVWIELPAAEKDLWARLYRALPLAVPVLEDSGPGIDKAAPKALMGFRDPVITVYADAAELEVYAVTKAIADSFDLYKGVEPLLERWGLPQAAGFPSALPFHEGAIRFLKEKSVWTPDHQRWQDAIIKRQSRLRQGWADMMGKEPAKSATPAALAELWMPRRAEILKSL